MKIKVDAKSNKQKINVTVVKSHRVPVGCLFIRTKDLAKFKKLARS